MSDLLQIKRKTSVTVTGTFFLDGTAQDVDSGLPTLTAAFPDGTALDPLPTVSGSWVGRTAGQYRFVLPTQPECTWLDWELTGPIGGLAQTIGGRVEWVGALLFTIGDLRAVRTSNGTPFTDTAAYPNELVAARRVEVTDDFEQRTGWSFVPRYHRELIIGTGTRELLLAKSKVQRILSASIDGTALTSTDLADLRAETFGRITRRSGATWPWDADVLVAYVHGWDRPPGAVSSAGLARAAMLLLPGISSTASSWTTPDGTTYTYDAAGRRLGSGVNHYGVPAIAEVLNQPAYSALGAVVA